MIAILAHALAYGGLAAMLGLVVWSFSRIGRAEEARLRALAAERGWSLPDTLDWEDGFTVDAGGASLEITKYLAKARAELGSREPRSVTASADELATEHDTLTLRVVDGQVVATSMRTTRDPETLAWLVDLAGGSDARAPAPPGRTPEASFFLATIALVPLSLLLGLGLTLSVAPVRSLQSRLLCGPGSELDWESYENGAHEYLEGCDGAGDGAENVSAVLLAAHTLGAPLLGGAFAFTRRRNP